MTEQLTATQKKLVTTAPGWEKWHAWNERSMRPLSDWVCEAAALTPGSRVIDVGCGAGIPSLAIAARLAPSGTVLATDISPDMLAGARRNARAAKLDNIEFRELGAESLDLPDESFDVVTCSFTLMFCADQARAVREMRRVLKPGGRFVILVWDEPQRNPFFTTVFQTVARFMPPPPPPDPKARGMFGLAPQAELASVLRAGGFSDFEIQSRAFEIEFESLEQHWQMFSEVAPPVKAAANTLPAEQLARLRQALAEALAPHLRGERPVLLATALGASGRK